MHLETGAAGLAQVDVAPDLQDWWSARKVFCFYCFSLPVMEREQAWNVIISDFYTPVFYHKIDCFLRFEKLYCAEQIRVC